MVSYTGMRIMGWEAGHLKLNRPVFCGFNLFEVGPEFRYLCSNFEADSEQGTHKRLAHEGACGWVARRTAELHT